MTRYTKIALCLLSCWSAPLLAQLNVSFQATPQTGKDPSVRALFSAVSAARFECAIDAEAFQSCASPYLRMPLTTGSHTLRVRAFDAQNNAGPTAEHTWSVTSLFAGAHPDLITTTQQPAAVAPNSWRGILRINCDFSHAGYNDPLVYPNQTGAAHYHNFYGAFDVNAQSSQAQLYTALPRTDGRVTSCQGNILNRSAYWVPSLLAPSYDANGVRLRDQNGEPAWKVINAVVGNDDVAHEVFYYAAGIDAINEVQAPPPGLSIIAGAAGTRPGSPQPTDVARWHCQSWNASDGQNPDFRAFIPECIFPDRMRFDLFFPSCWNGVDIDSADHKSHMAYPSRVNGQMRCPTSHPVAVPRVSYHYAFAVRPDNVDPPSRSSRGWRLSSDMYTVTSQEPGGYSLHGDWMNGWHPEAMQALLQGCIRGAKDCHDGNLANGFRLSGTAAGVQLAQPIINQGLGTSMNLDRIFGSGFEEISAADLHMHH
jgi:Domain of unknown function (DUF1996)